MQVSVTRLFCIAGARIALLAQKSRIFLHLYETEMIRNQPRRSGSGLGYELRYYCYYWEYKKQAENIATDLAHFSSVDINCVY